MPKNDEGMLNPVIEPIGFFQAIEKERYAVGRQAGIIQGNEGVILLNTQSNYKQALGDLSGFSRIWVIYRFHRNHHWKPKVLPPRGEKKRGVFATRSPHRPNFIGLSCVELIKVEDLKLYIKNHDLLDGTPVLDIKPYLVYADSFPDAKQGWLEELESGKEWSVEWSCVAERQVEYLEKEWQVLIKANVMPRLEVNPYPSRSNRIREVGDGESDGDGKYEIAYKSWRVIYRLSGEQVVVKEVSSGYSESERGLHAEHEAFHKFSVSS